MYVYMYCRSACCAANQPLQSRKCPFALCCRCGQRMTRVGDLDSELEINAQGLRCRSFSVRCCVCVCVREFVKHVGMKRGLNEATPEREHEREHEQQRESSERANAHTCSLAQRAFAAAAFLCVMWALRLYLCLI